MDETAKKAARKILRVFKDKGLGAGEFLDFAAFGSALAVEAGHLKHDSQLEALQFLVEKGYVQQMNSGVELTAKGASVLDKV